MNSERLHQSLRPLSSNTQDYIEELLKTQKSKSQGELYNQMQKFIDKYRKKEDVVEPNQSGNTQKWMMPCRGRIVGQFGEKRPTHIHNGIDIAVPKNTSVKAIADGVVYYAGDNDPKGYGKYVIITHTINGKTVTSEYGHLSSWNVKKDQKVFKGQEIAKSGNTGHSEGPHVHLTIREGKYKGIPVNPFKYILKY